MCRSRRELSNAYFLSKFGFDTAENEPCKVCRIPRASRLPASEVPRGSAAVRDAHAEAPARGLPADAERASRPVRPSHREMLQRMPLSLPRDPSLFLNTGLKEKGCTRASTAPPQWKLLKKHVAIWGKLLALWSNRLFPPFSLRAKKGRGPWISSTWTSISRRRKCGWPS